VIRARAKTSDQCKSHTLDLRGPKGAVIGKTISSPIVSTYVYVEVRQPGEKRHSPAPLGPGLYADALVPFLDPASGKPPVNSKIRAAPFDVELGKNQTAVDRRVGPPKRRARQVPWLLQSDQRSGKRDWRP